MQDAVPLNYCSRCRLMCSTINRMCTVEQLLDIRSTYKILLCVNINDKTLLNRIVINLQFQLPTVFKDR